MSPYFSNRACSSSAPRSAHVLRLRSFSIIFTTKRWSSKTKTSLKAPQPAGLMTCSSAKVTAGFLGTKTPAARVLFALGLHEPIRAKCFHQHGRTTGRRSDMSQFFNDYIYLKTLRNRTTTQEPALAHNNQTSSNMFWSATSLRQIFMFTPPDRFEPGNVQFACSKEVNMDSTYECAQSTAKY